MTNYIVTIITSISIYPVSLQNQICFLVNGVGVFRACGGEGESDDQGVFCTTGPYFHVQNNGFDLGGLPKKKPFFWEISPKYGWVGLQIPKLLVTFTNHYFSA